MICFLPTEEEVSLTEGLANYVLLPIFMNKILLEHSHVHLSIGYGCFLTTTAELNSWDRL